MALLTSHRNFLSKEIFNHGLQEFEGRIINGSYSAYLLVGSEQIESPEIGVSRFGGDPDVNAAFNPTGIEDLVFIYQVNFADLPNARKLGLPNTGLLSVFSDSEAEGGRTFFFKDQHLHRFKMPAKDPEYIFSNMKPWNLSVRSVVEIPDFGSDLVDDVDDAGLDAEYESLCKSIQTKFDEKLCFGQILGRFSELNGDMRSEAVENCGGELENWLSFWRVYSSFESGLVISDFHLLHGMIRKQELDLLSFGDMFTISSNG